VFFLLKVEEISLKVEKTGQSGRNKGLNFHTLTEKVERISHRWKDQGIGRIFQEGRPGSKGGRNNTRGITVININIINHLKSNA